MGIIQIYGQGFPPGSVTNESISANAGIETSKFADGSLFLKSDGTVELINNWLMGAYSVTAEHVFISATSGFTSTEAVPKSYVDAISANINDNVSGTVGAVAVFDTTNSATGYDAFTFTGATLHIHGQLQQGTNTTASGQNSIATGLLTLAGGSNTRANGIGATASHNNSYIWSSGGIETSHADAFHIYASNGVRLLSNTKIYATTTNASSDYELATKGYVDANSGGGNAGLTGSVGQIPIFVATGSATGSSSISSDGTNLLVNGDIFATDIQGTQLFSPTFRFGGGSEGIYKTYGTYGGYIEFSSGYGFALNSAHSNGNIKFMIGADEKMRLSNGGQLQQKQGLSASNYSYILTGITTDATPVTLTNYSGMIAIDTNSTFVFSTRVVARGNDGNYAGFYYSGIGSKDTTSASTTVWLDNYGQYANSYTGYDMSVTSDTTNGTLGLSGVGEAGVTVYWTAFVELTTVIQ